MGLSVAATRPDLLYAYLGMGQIIDFRENETVSYVQVLKQARLDHNMQAIKELEEIAPYPGAGRFDIEKTGVERKWSIYYGGLAAGRRDSDFYLHMGRLSPEYDPTDRKAWDDGSDLTMKTMWPSLAAVTFENLRRIDVPVFFLLGRHDTTAPPELVAAWLGKLQAPAKSMIWFDNSAHLPMIEEPGHMLEILHTRIRSLAGTDVAPNE